MSNIDVPKRVEIYLAPCRRNDREPDGEIEQRLRIQLMVEGIKNPLIIGNPAGSLFDYAVENLDSSSATRLAGRINQLEGYATKIRDWWP